MKDVFVTIVGPDTMFKERRNVKEGEIITLRKTPSTKYPHHIQAYRNDVSIGSVADNPDTVRGSSYSSDIKDVFETEITAIVTAARNETVGSTIKTYLIAKIVEENTQKILGGIEKMEKKVKVVLGGAGNVVKAKKPIYQLIGNYSKESTNPNSAFAYVGQGIPVDVEFDQASSQIKFIYEGQLAGLLSSTDKQTTGYATYDDVVKLIMKHKNADGSFDCVVNIEPTLLESVKLTAVIEFTSESGIDAATAKIVGGGIATTEEINSIIRQLEAADVNEMNILKLLSTMKKIPEGFKIPKGNFKFIDDKEKHIILTSVCALNSGLHLLLEGPKGCGKNTLADDISRFTRRPLGEVQINYYTDNETLLGTRTIKAKNSCINKEEVNACVNELVRMLKDSTLSPTRKSVVKKAIDSGSQDELTNAVEQASNEVMFDFTPLLEAIRGGQTEVVFEPSTLVKMMEVGGICVLDELNTGNPGVIALLNSVLDMRARIDVPGYGLVEAHENFRVIATMNRDYQGTIEMNEATRDRFLTVVFSPAKSIQDVIKKNVVNVSKETLTLCDKIYNHIITGVDAGNIQSSSLSIRSFVRAAQLITDGGMDMRKAFESAVVNSCTDTEDRKAIMKVILGLASK